MAWNWTAENWSLNNGNMFPPSQLEEGKCLSGEITWVDGSGEKDEPKMTYFISKIPPEKNKKNPGETKLKYPLLDKSWVWGSSKDAHCLKHSESCSWNLVLWQHQLAAEHVGHLRLLKLHCTSKVQTAVFVKEGFVLWPLLAYQNSSQ